MKLFGFCIFAAAMTFMIQCSSAARISITETTIGSNAYGDNCLISSISLEGEIEEGDTGRLREAISKITKEAAEKYSACYVNDGVDQRLIYVSMNSPGGLYTEGWKIAKLLGEPDTLAATYVGRQDFCYSACAIAFLGGSAPGAEGSSVLRRVIHPTAKIGFHAPFPILDDKSYTSKDIMSFFLAAFVVSHEFVLEAKSLGIDPEIAQLLLQPTPDRFFEINTVGRALMTSISVSQGKFDFSIYEEGLQRVSNQNILNLCFNNIILKAKGDIAAATEFVKHQRTVSYLPVKTTSNYFTPDSASAEGIIVPVADAGEGEVLSCVAVTARIAESENAREITKFSCLGFEYGFESVATRVAREGTDWIWRDRSEAGCMTSSRLALVPWTTKLADVPSELLED